MRCSRSPSTHPATAEVHPLSLHDALPICGDVHLIGGPKTIGTFHAIGALDTLELVVLPMLFGGGMQLTPVLRPDTGRSEEHTSELQSHVKLVCRLPPEKTKQCSNGWTAWA